MNCPKCGSPLEPSTDSKERPFKLQYGRKWESTYICSAGCPGLWTETSIGLYQEMIQRERKKRRAILEERPAPEGH